MKMPHSSNSISFYHLLLFPGFLVLFVFFLLMSVLWFGHALITN